MWKETWELRRMTFENESFRVQVQPAWDHSEGWAPSIRYAHWYYTKLDGLPMPASKYGGTVVRDPEETEQDFAARLKSLIESRLKELGTE